VGSSGPRPSRLADTTLHREPIGDRKVQSGAVAQSAFCVRANIVGVATGVTIYAEGHRSVICAACRSTGPWVTHVRPRA
jgi:hypothetical protein